MPQQSLVCVVFSMWFGLDVYFVCVCVFLLVFFFCFCFVLVWFLHRYVWYWLHLVNCRYYDLICSLFYSRLKKSSRKQSKRSDGNCEYWSFVSYVTAKYISFCMCWPLHSHHGTIELVSPTCFHPLITRKATIKQMQLQKGPVNQIYVVCIWNRKSGFHCDHNIETAQCRIY